jgi:hypothetical protein
MKTFKLLVGLCVLAIGAVRGSDEVLSTNDIVAIAGVSGLTNSAKSNLGDIKKKEPESGQGLFDLKAPILEVRTKPDLSPLANFVWELVPGNGLHSEGKWAGTTLTSLENRMGRRFIETRDIYALNWRINEETCLQLPRTDFVGPNGGYILSVCITKDF